MPVSNEPRGVIAAQEPSMASENFDNKNSIVFTTLSRIPGTARKAAQRSPNHREWKSLRRPPDQRHGSRRESISQTPEGTNATSFVRISDLHQPAHENHRSPHPPNPQGYVAHHGHIGLGNNDSGRRRNRSGQGPQNPDRTEGSADRYRWNHSASRSRNTNMERIRVNREGKNASC